MKFVISSAVLLLDGHSGSFQFVWISNVGTFRADLLDPSFYGHSCFIVDIRVQPSHDRSG